MRRIVVGSDQSHGSRGALDWALAEARPDDQIVIAHAWPVEWVGPEASVIQAERSAFGRRAQDLLAEEAAYARERAGDDGPEITTAFHETHAGAMLVELSRDADMVVVGRRGLGGFARLLLGSVSDSVVHHAACVVVVVPSDGQT